jgi:hypothetical protein
MRERRAACSISTKTTGGLHCGSLFALAPGKGIQAHRQPNGALHTYVALKKPEDWIGNIDFSDPATALACIAQEFDDWAPERTALIIDGETDPVGRPIYALERWQIPFSQAGMSVKSPTTMGFEAWHISPTPSAATTSQRPGSTASRIVFNRYRRDSHTVPAVFAVAHGGFV